MTPDQIKIGQRVRTNVSWSGVRAGAEGVIDEDYGSGIMVCWDLPENPLPKGYCVYNGRPAIKSGLLRDGFDKETELGYLEVI